MVDEQNPQPRHILGGLGGVICYCLRKHTEGNVITTHVEPADGARRCRAGFFYIRLSE